MLHNKLADYAVVLVNLGTPDEATVPAVQRYLKQFLSDQRVVDYPAPLWQLILRGIILPFRGRRVAKLYQSIWWPEGSPLRVITQRQTTALAQQLAMSDTPVQVRYAMTYGNPSIASVLDSLRSEGVRKFVVLPLYPQYSATTTAAIADQLAHYQLRQRDIAEIRLVKHYHHEVLYRKALAGSVQAHWQQHGKADKLLLSFHGIPERFVRLGDPYEQHCRQTAANLAQDLGLAAEQVLVSFQSRVGKEKWLRHTPTSCCNNCLRRALSGCRCCARLLPPTAWKRWKKLLKKTKKYFCMQVVRTINTSPR